MNDNDPTTEIRDAILEHALPAVIFHGWTDALLNEAVRESGYEAAYSQAVFPAGAPDLVDHFADWTDRQMLAALEDHDPSSLRVRDRVALAVKTRVDCLSPHKEAVRLALSYWATPLRSSSGISALWRTADHIWVWAGDTATDYNRYTKRVLLSGVISATFLYWMNDQNNDKAALSDFVERRIGEVLNIGRFFGKIKGLKENLKTGPQACHKDKEERP